MKIVFLDIDGVLCTGRAALAYEDSGIARTLDPVGIAFLNRLYCETGAYYVVTSYWRKEVMVPIVLRAAGCIMPSPAAWRTDSEDNIPSIDARPAEIAAYILQAERRGEMVENYIILDDDSFNWTEEQAQRFVRCDTMNGISQRGMDRALSLLRDRPDDDLDPPRIRSHGFTPANMPAAHGDWSAVNG